jgi:hypothetical protein
VILTRGHLEALAAAVLAIILGILGYQYLQARDDRVKMDATIQAQKQVIDQATADRAQHAKEDAARDAATAAQLDAMSKAVAQIRTPQQIVGWSQQQLADAIRGIQITVPAPTAANPHPEATVTIPENSLPGLRDTIEQCKECAVKLNTAQADLESRLQQMKEADAQIQALKTERDVAVKAAKGGTAWQRAWKVVKYVAIGGAIGYAVGHK